MATFRKRSGGWRAEICKLGLRESRTFVTKGQAVAWAIQREADILSGVASPANDTTLRQVLERYRDEVSPTKAGQRWEQLRIDAFMRAVDFVDLPVAQVGADKIARWRDARLKTVSAPTVTREMNLLSSVFEMARKEWRWCQHNPVGEIKRPGHHKPRDRRVREDEISVLLSAMGYVEGRAPVLHMQEVAYAFLIALETAMRKGEILGLAVGDVHLAQRFVRLDMTKNGDARDVPLSRRAVELLAVLVRAAQARGETRVFRVNPASADPLFRRARRRCGIDDLHFHDTRHEATTRLARKLDVLDLARMTGHRDPRSLMVYYNATASEVASRLD